MIYGMIALGLIGMVMLYVMIRMFLDTNRYSFRNVRVHKKQNAGRLLGVFGSICLLIGIILYVLRF